MHTVVRGGAQTRTVDVLAGFALQAIVLGVLVDDTRLSGCRQINQEQHTHQAILNSAHHQLTITLTVLTSPSSWLSWNIYTPDCAGSLTS